MPQVWKIFLPGTIFSSYRMGFFVHSETLTCGIRIIPIFTECDAFGQIGLEARRTERQVRAGCNRNPDFSQIESDEPQVTVNQRFEVQFPEKRPFFLENSNYFQTPIPLLFTRRIVDPKWGVRLTGKDGPWAVGMLVADDASPGERSLRTTLCSEDTPILPWAG